MGREPSCVARRSERGGSAHRPKGTDAKGSLTHLGKTRGAHDKCQYMMNWDENRLFFFKLVPILTLVSGEEGLNNNNNNNNCWFYPHLTGDVCGLDITDRPPSKI